MSTTTGDDLLDDCKENEMTANEPAKTAEPAKGRGRKKPASAPSKKEPAKSTSKRGKGKKADVPEPAPEPEKKEEKVEEKKEEEEPKKEEEEKPKEEEPKEEPKEEVKPEEKKVEEVEPKAKEEEETKKEETKKEETKKEETKKEETKKEETKDTSVTTTAAKKSPRRKETKSNKDDEEKPKKSPKKKARASPKRKASTKNEDEDDEDEGEMDLKDDEDEDEDMESDDDDDEFESQIPEDPEDEDVEGKGYGHVLMFTCVPADVRSKLVKGVKEIPDGYMTRNLNFATHVVCDTPMRTIKLMAAILRGVWVVSSKWVTESVAAKRWLPEESYEVTQYPGTKLSREAHAKTPAGEQTPGLFAGMSFVIGHTEHTNPTKSEVRELVVTGGGQALLTKEIEKTQFYLACPSRPIPTNLPESARVVTQSAFFDAISNYAKPVSVPAPKPVAATENPASFEPPSETN